ncbi:hypothetical protein [Ruficoccus sp. ZRK36]|uniref:hypothetical protein n=1 Tax=Ruficoccus sp. ZRK36 TaxID=2866311 RepID=UPI001C731E25|nr:hypothetical protein [Ruficoccus sp. ZRK36]QYY35310.1 hypothetical protein K0V07_13540 [Ruficoccus sp. ZRK36]
MYDMSRIIARALAESSVKILSTFITAEDLTEETANTAQVIAAFQAKPGDMVLGVGYSLETPFADASDAAFNTNTIQVGDGVDPDRLLASLQANANGSFVKYGSSAGGAMPFTYTAEDTIDVTVGAMSGKSLVNIDTGKLWLHLFYHNLKDLSQ